jgi:hypothetical protein
VSLQGCYKKLLPYVFSIKTPEGSGSGFFLGYNEDRSISAFATAAHVVEDAEDWKKPIRLRHHDTGQEQFLKDGDRVVWLDRRRDSALILITTPGFELPKAALPMMPADKYQPVGSEIAWVGYPGIASPHLCMFRGMVSAFLTSDDSYLIDGVAINGVSGGPVFSERGDGLPTLLGTVSAYLPNRNRGDSLPGLMSAQDVAPFHDMLQTLTSIDEARRKKQADEEARAKEEQQAEQLPPSQSDVDTRRPNNSLERTRAR